MALEMKAACEKCGAALEMDGEVYICSYERTFCPGCATPMKHDCPNCGGELRRRAETAGAARVVVNFLNRRGLLTDHDS